MWWFVIFGNFVYKTAAFWKKSLSQEKISPKVLYPHNLCHILPPTPPSETWHILVTSLLLHLPNAAPSRGPGLLKLTDASCVAWNWKFGSKPHTKFINELQRLLVNTDGYKPGLRHSTVHPLSLREEWTNYKQTKSHSCFGEQENHVLMMLFHYTAAFQPQPRVKV